MSKFKKGDHVYWVDVEGEKMKVKIIDSAGYGSLDDINFPVIVNAEYDTEFDDGVSAVIVQVGEFKLSKSKIMQYKPLSYWFYNTHDEKEFEVVE